MQRHHARGAAVAVARGFGLRGRRASSTDYTISSPCTAAAVKRCVATPCTETHAGFEQQTVVTDRLTDDAFLLVTSRAMANARR